MSLPVWGLLEKSQIDPEKIEEAIARLILAHDNNPDSHLGATGSLLSHKAEEIIDHIADSIIADKIKDGEVNLAKLSADKFIYFTHFESVANFPEKAGNVFVSGYGLNLLTSNVLNNIAYIQGAMAGNLNFLDFTKNLFFQTTLFVGNDISEIVYAKVGALDFDDYDDGFGFKISGSILEALHIKTVAGSPVEYTTWIPGITLTDPHVYRAKYDFSAGKIYFYVDGVLRATHSANLPANPVTDIFVSYYIKTVTTAVRQLYITDLLITRDK